MCAKVLRELSGAHPVVPLIARFRKLNTLEVRSEDLAEAGPRWSREGLGICRLRPVFLQARSVSRDGAAPFESGG